MIRRAWGYHIEMVHALDNGRTPSNEINNCSSASSSEAILELSLSLAMLITILVHDIARIYLPW